jgi:hypothetical protein
VLCQSMEEGKTHSPVALYGIFFFINNDHPFMGRIEINLLLTLVTYLLPDLLFAVFSFFYLETAQTKCKKYVPLHVRIDFVSNKGGGLWNQKRLCERHWKHIFDRRYVIWIIHDWLGLSSFPLQH